MTLENIRLLKLHQVCEQTGLSKSTIYRLMEYKRFPHPIRIGDRASRWVDREIQDYIGEKMAARS